MCKEHKKKREKGFGLIPQMIILRHIKNTAIDFEICFFDGLSCLRFFVSSPSTCLLVRFTMSSKHG
jgi:hypothetical protein